MEEEIIKHLFIDIQNFRDELKSKSRSNYDRISNKDILFFFLHEIRSLDKRITRTETRQKMFMWCTIACIGIVGIIGGTI